MSCDYLQSCEYLQCFGSSPSSPSERAAVSTVIDGADSWTKSLFNQQRQQYIHLLIAAKKHNFNYLSSQISYPPINESQSKKNGKLITIADACECTKIARIDPELGVFSFTDQLWYNWYSSKSFYSFSDDTHKDQWASGIQTQKWFNFSIQQQIFNKFIKIQRNFSRGRAPEYCMFSVSNVTPRKHFSVFC